MLRYGYGARTQDSKDIHSSKKTDRTAVIIFPIYKSNSVTCVCVSVCHNLQALERGRNEKYKIESLHTNNTYVNGIQVFSKKIYKVSYDTYVNLQNSMQCHIYPYFYLAVFLIVFVFDMLIGFQNVRTVPVPVCTYIQVFYLSILFYFLIYGKVSVLESTILYTGREKKL